MIRNILTKINVLAHTRVGALLCNMLLALAVLTLSRAVFIAWNWDRYTGYVDGELLGSIFRGGLRFDLATLFYVNTLWVLLFLVPVSVSRNSVYGRVVKAVYVVLNSVALLSNLCDTVYVGYTGRRTTMTLFQEFANEDNILTVVGNELLHSWLLVLLMIALVWFMWRLYVSPRQGEASLWRRIAVSLAALAVVALCAVGAIRGGVDRTTRPITLSNANEYVNRPIEAAAVLNTPFSIIRSIGKSVFAVPEYMPADEAAGLYPIVHHPADRGLPH